MYLGDIAWWVDKNKGGKDVGDALERVYYRPSNQKGELNARKSLIHHKYPKDRFSPTCVCQKQIISNQSNFLL